MAVAALAASGAAYCQEPTAATVVTAQGRVSVLRHGEAWALFPGHSVRVGEVIKTGPDGYAQLQIADGSYFEVYADSQVVFRANPGNLRELVEVLLGKIRLYIQHFGGRPNPYRVHSPTAVISVRGTVFDVAVEPDTVTSVWVTEGVVAVQHRLLPTKVVTVTAGEHLRIFPNAPLAQAGVNKLGIAAKVAGAIRDTIYSLPRRGGGGGGTRGPSGGGAGGGGGGGLPTDTGAPPPPPPPTDREAPPPPPPPQ